MRGNRKGGDGPSANSALQRRGGLASWAANDARGHRDGGVYLRSNLKGCLLVAAATIFWGAAGVAVRFIFTARDIDPVTLVQFRMTLACLVIGVYLALTKPGLLKVKAGALPFLVVYGAIGLAANQFAYYWAIHETGVAVAIFLQSLAPVFTALYEVVILGRRPGRATLPVLGVAVSGSLLLVLGSAGGFAVTPVGLIAGFAAAVTLAFYSLAGQRGLVGHHPWTLLFWGTLSASVLWAVIQPPWVVLARPWTAADWTFFFYLAIFSVAIPFSLYLTGLRLVGPTSAVLTATLEPVWAGTLAWFFLGETLSLTQVAGCLLILSAIVALQAAGGAIATGTGQPAGHAPAPPPTRRPGS